MSGRLAGARNELMDSYTKHHFQIHGVDSYYVRLGSGPPLLFIHGLGVTPSTYQPLIDELAQHYTVYAPQVPGFGLSDAPPAVWHFTDYATFIDRFLEQRQLKEVPVVGHSFGGGIGIAAAAISPRVHRVVAINPAGVPLDIPWWRLLYNVFAKTVMGMVLRKQTLPFRLLRDFVLSFVRKFLVLPRLSRIINKNLYGDNPTLRAVKAPVLILWATSDELFPVGYAEYLKRVIPGASVRYETGHHNWCFFQPRLAVSHIREYLS